MVFVAVRTHFLKKNTRVYVGESLFHVKNQYKLQLTSSYRCHRRSEEVQTLARSIQYQGGKNFCNKYQQ